MRATFPHLPAVLCAALVSALASQPAAAQSVPPLINYQGRLVNSNNIPLSTGDYELRFSLWDAATGGTQVWGPQIFNGQTGPGLGPKVPVVHGWFNVMLGPVDTNGASLVNAFTNANRFVEIKVGANPALAPRQQILSAPYALKAERAATADQALAVLGATTTGDLVFFVSTNGSDVNDGLASSRPKRTIQAAVDAVPSLLAHRVEIQISPGIYPEAVRILNKRPLDSSRVDLHMKGMGSTPDAVSISGADSSGNPVRQYGLFLQESGVSIFNISVSKTTSAGICAYYRANFSAFSCNFRDCRPEGITVGGLSTVSLCDCVFECSGVPGMWGMEASGGSIVGFRDDLGVYDGQDGIPAKIGDPDNLIRNTFRNYQTGIWVLSGATVAGSQSVLFDRVTTPVVQDSGGRAP